MYDTERKSIAFDFDGVLFDSEHLNFLATKRAFDLYGIRLSKEEYINYWLLRKKIKRGEKSIEGYIRLKNKPIDYNEVIQERKPIWEKLYEKNLKLLPGTRKAIKLLHSQNFPMCIVSHNYSKYIKKALKKFNLSNYFEFIISLEELKNFKPHPEPYALAVKRFNSQPQNVIAIEDNPIGIESAKKAGVKCIAIPNGLTKKCDFSRADCIVKSLKELNMDIIKKL